MRNVAKSAREGNKRAQVATNSCRLNNSSRNHILQPASRANHPYRHPASRTGFPEQPRANLHRSS
jgi:hypothetical protein